MVETEKHWKRMRNVCYQIKRIFPWRTFVYFEEIAYDKVYWMHMIEKYGELDSVQFLKSYDEYYSVYDMCGKLQIWS